MHHHRSPLAASTKASIGHSKAGKERAEDQRLDPAADQQRRVQRDHHREMAAAGLHVARPGLGRMPLSNNVTSSASRSNAMTTSTT